MARVEVGWSRRPEEHLPSLTSQTASPGTHDALGAEAGGRIDRKRQPFTTSSELDTGRGCAGDLWILCFHQYCIGPPPPPAWRPQLTACPPAGPRLNVGGQGQLQPAPGAAAHGDKLIV